MLKVYTVKTIAVSNQCLYKILAIIGVRPQSIKARVVSKVIADTGVLAEVIIHTGQYFDANMSDTFFDQLTIPKSHHLFNDNGASHGDMTERMLVEIEKVLIAEKPDCVIVYCYINSTLASALPLLSYIFRWCMWRRVFVVLIYRCWKV